MTDSNEREPDKQPDEFPFKNIGRAKENPERDLNVKIEEAVLSRRSIMTSDAETWEKAKVITEKEGLTNTEVIVTPDTDLDQALSSAFEHGLGEAIVSELKEEYGDEYWLKDLLAELDEKDEELNIREVAANMAIFLKMEPSIDPDSEEVHQLTNDLREVSRELRTMIISLIPKNMSFTELNVMSQQL